ncbi:adipocyte plasma membrane-associated protein [Folsomia candida]|uniref:adipocyte plasma membrane-associated protein n=1 Tax=Folsomia candida TaxID=158441 RepID=UPI000B9032E7|nr:adipocyte plasma membrane-associated protein [Folsomia candida]
MGVVLLTFQMFFFTLVLVLFIMLVPGIPPHYKFEAYSLRPPRKMEGKLTPNDILDRAELVVEGKFIGPESVAVLGDFVYTGVHGGGIIRVDAKGDWKKVAQIEGECDDNWKSPCPRPLGLRFAKDGKLIVADGYKGLVEVDVNSGANKVILPFGTIMDYDQLPINFVDDLDIDRDGVIYFSDASQVSTMGNIFPEAFGEPTGRLIKFDPKTKKTEVLINRLHFANGVQLSRKEDFVVVCESVRSRVWKYHLQGPKKGTKEVFIEGLPGICDNIRSNGKGGFYISLVTPDNEETPNSMRQFMAIPAVKKLILRVQYLLRASLELIDSYFSNPLTKIAHSYVCHLGPFGDTKYMPSKVIIVDIEESGNILGSLQTKNGQMAFISEIGLGGKFTYFGSPYTDKLWRIKTEYLV